MAQREHGYMLTVKMFVPVERKDTKDVIAKAQAVEAAQSSNDLSGLVGSGDILSVAHRWTSREKAEATIVHEPAETVEEIAAVPDLADDTGPGSVGEEQMAATEEAASTEPRRRRA